MDNDPSFLILTSCLILLLYAWFWEEEEMGKVIERVSKNDFTIEFSEMISRLPELLEKLGIVDQSSIRVVRFPYYVEMDIATHASIHVYPFHRKDVMVLEGVAMCCRGTKYVVFLRERPVGDGNALKLAFYLKLRSFHWPKGTELNSDLLEKVISDFVEKALKGFCFV